MMVDWRIWITTTFSSYTFNAEAEAELPQNHAQKEETTNMKMWIIL